MTKIINAYKLRTNLGEFLNEVYYRGNDVIVERRGKPLVKITKIIPDIPGIICNLDGSDKRVKLLELAGSLSPDRAKEMKKVIYKTRALSKQAVQL